MCSSDLVLLPAAQETLALQHGDPVALDLFGEIALREQGGEMRDGLCVLLLRVEAQGESLPRHVGLGMGGILLQKLLKASDGGRVELPVIGPVGEEVEIEGGILPLRLARRCEEQRKEEIGGASCRERV